jgi:hypothetical protein
MQWSFAPSLGPVGLAGVDLLPVVIMCHRVVQHIVTRARHGRSNRSLYGMVKTPQQYCYSRLEMVSSLRYLNVA